MDATAKQRWHDTLIEILRACEVDAVTANTVETVLFADGDDLPLITPDEAAARSAAIAHALVAAASVPAIVIAVAEQVLTLAEQLLPIGNRNVISDVAAAAEAARAAATTARVNVEINLGGIKDPVTWGELAAVVETVDDLVLRAEKVTAAVRDGLVR